MCSLNASSSIGNKAHLFELLLELDEDDDEGS